MRIAIVGAGISGLVVAYHLRRQHDITVYEAGNYVGGHTHTVPVERGGRTWWIDTGFIVFNDRTYPNFVALLGELKIDSQPATMSFSVRCDDSGLEYNGTSLGGMFAQRRNLASVRFHRFLLDILRFNRDALGRGSLLPEDLTVEQFLEASRYGPWFSKYYLLPLGSAIWSCPAAQFGQFPIRFVIDFYRHHGLLQLRNRPQWHVVSGGSHRYVAALTAGFRNRIRLSAPVRQIRRDAEGVDLVTDGATERFDRVVLACHADQALRLLSAPTVTERELLAAFPYQENSAVLHTDCSRLPRLSRAWAAWNYRLSAAEGDRASVTYNMNLLQGLSAPVTFCVSLNQEEQIDPQHVIARFMYHHPVYTVGRDRAARRHHELLAANRTSFCGAYWGNGFHEDGVVSALAVCRAITKEAA